MELKLKNFGRALRDGVSRAAEAVGLPRIKGKQSVYKVDGKVGERGKRYRSYINYTQKGPFYEQIGWQPGGAPLMARVFIHSFLHATKGWRVRRTSGPTVALSNMQDHRVYGPRAYGYQSNHGWLNTAKPVPGSAGAVLVPYFRKDRKKVGQQHPGMHTMERREMFRAPLVA